ncbi:hypothetical protein FA95DRAFT_1590182 [Auriscalpium vulgare]|uniref:Uncharacterized protein n=1 Tax=Auriscalpium vulgare TaxID=40419 RepID=A0ACB8RKC7_9AGAM|nr:hypothetical protein FA95DRAFT_1590182 [Auriscalpium vulgare]
MSHPETLTIGSLLDLASLQGAYSLGYAFIFGTSLWVTFVGGTIAYKTLPRQQFGAFQHKVFAIYFNLNMVITTGLLSTWILTHPDVLVHYKRPTVPNVAQAYTLITALLSAALNSFVINPLTSKTMFARFQQEKDESKTYNEPGVSDAMKALNKKFGRLHAYSEIFNLAAFLALAFHGLWIGNHGI